MSIFVLDISLDANSAYGGKCNLIVGNLSQTMLLRW